MKCPKCGGNAITTKTTRPHGDTTVRKRQCRSCGNAFYTREAVIDYQEGYDAVSEFYRDREKYYRNRKAMKEV